MSRQVKITADAPCDIGPMLQERYGVALAPLHVTMNDQEYLDKSANMNAKTKDPYNAQRFEDAIALFDYGYKQMSQFLTVQDLIDMGMPVSFPCEVQNAAKNDPQNGMLTVSPRLDYSQQLQLMQPFMEKITENITNLADTKIGTLVAPINAGDVVGTVEYKVGDSVLFTSNLYADRDVKEGILNSEPSEPVVNAQEQPQVSVGAPLMGTASTLTGEPVKQSSFKRTLLIVLVVLFVIVLIAFVAFMIVVRIRRERRRKARAAARRRKRMQQERIARQRAAEQGRRS